MKTIEILAIIVACLEVVNLLLLFFMIFLEKKKPQSIIAWMTILTFMPVVGFLFYVVLFVYGEISEKITHDRLKIAWNRWLKPIGLEENTGSFTVCSKHFIVTEGGELVSQVATAITVEEILCLINTTLQPGQKLIIDAGTYNVLIDGENAIYTQQGEWLDELNRNTMSITITAKNANKPTLKNLSASILYTERYL